MFFSFPITIGAKSSAKVQQKNELCKFSGNYFLEKF